MIFGHKDAFVLVVNMLGLYKRLLCIIYHFRQGRHPTLLMPCHKYGFQIFNEVATLTQDERYCLHLLIGKTF